MTKEKITLSEKPSQLEIGEKLALNGIPEECLDINNKLKSIFYLINDNNNKILDYDNRYLTTKELQDVYEKIRKAIKPIIDKLTPEQASETCMYAFMGKNEGDMSKYLKNKEYYSIIKPLFISPKEIPTLIFNEFAVFSNKINSNVKD